MGRPRKELDEQQLRAFCRLKPRIGDVAAFFQVSEDTVERRIKELGYSNFAAFRDENMVHTRFSLIRKAIHMGEGGNVPMLIFGLKNLCGWTDKQEITEKNTTNLSDEEMLTELSRSVEALQEKIRAKQND